MKKFAKLIKESIDNEIKRFLGEEASIRLDVMNEFYNIKTNGHNPVKINEETIDRILSKHSENGMAVISANRSDKDGAYNNSATRSLIQDIKQAGYSYIPVYGGYHGSDDVVDSLEPSFVVTNYDRKGNPLDFEALKEFAIEMCDKYNQDSVLVQEPGGKPQYLKSDGSVDMEFNNVIKNDPSKEFYTSLIKTKNLDTQHPERLKRYTYECYVNPKPCTYSERYKRRNNGEILI